MKAKGQTAKTAKRSGGRKRGGTKLGGEEEEGLYNTPKEEEKPEAGHKGSKSMDVKETILKVQDRVRNRMETGSM